MADLKAIWYLKQTDLFSWIDEEVAHLMRPIKDHEVKRGEAVYLAHTPGMSTFSSRAGSRTPA